VGTDNYFYGCRAWQNSDDGFDGYLRPSNNITTTLENCWSFQNGYLSDGTTSSGNGNGFKMGGSDARDLEHNMILKNCLTFDNMAKGFDQNHNKASMVLLNCTGYRNGGIDYSVNEALDSGKTLTLTNCIEIGNKEIGNKRSIGAFAIQTTNSWMAPFVPPTSGDFISLDTSGVRGPRKPDGSLPDFGFLHLAPGSQYVDAGTDVGMAFNGSAPDLGCFETDGITSIRSDARSPFTLTLDQNYPNPFNPETNIKFFVAATGHAVLTVYNLAGQRVVTLFNDVPQAGQQYNPGGIAGSQPPGPACQNIVIADCVVYHAHGGFVIGSESYGGARNVSVRNCVFVGTDVGLRFKSPRGRGGSVEKVFIDGIQMRAIETDAILFDMYYFGGAPDVEATKDLTVRKAEPLTEKAPRFQDFSIRNVVCNGARRAAVINGLPEMPIKNIVLDSVSVSAKGGVILADAEGIQLNGCRIVAESGPVISVLQGRNITVNGGTFPVAADVFLKVAGEKSENINLVGIDLAKVKREVELGENVKPDAVIRR
jgi:hypothetical protein